MASLFSPHSAPFYPAIFHPIVAPNKKVLEYPFSYIGYGTDYRVSGFQRGLIDEAPLDCGDFPNNITQFFWISEGKNDERPWYCLCQLDNGIYAFYRAFCDYTGFDCQGGMQLFVSRDLRKLFYEGMTSKERELYWSSR